MPEVAAERKRCAASEGERLAADDVLIADDLLAADDVVERDLATSDFEPIARVHRLDIEDLATSEPKHALHGSGHVFVHAVRELDDDDGALAGRSDKPADHSA
jgi:hypothetical protein